MEIDRKIYYINSVAFVRPDGIPVVLVKFAACYKKGEVKPETGAFTGFTWANAEEAAELDCIKGVQGEISKTIRLFKQISS